MAVEPLALFEIDDQSVKMPNKHWLTCIMKESIKKVIFYGRQSILQYRILPDVHSLLNYDFIDLSTLTEESEVRNALHEYSVFGRVSPQQKKILVDELKESGRTVAMTRRWRQ